MWSLLVGVFVGGLYCLGLQRTARCHSLQSSTVEVRRALGGFFLRLIIISLVFIVLARFTVLNMPSVVIAFIIVYSTYLLQAAVRAFVCGMKRRQLSSK